AANTPNRSRIKLSWRRRANRAAFLPDLIRRSSRRQSRLDPGKNFTEYAVVALPVQQEVWAALEARPVLFARKVAVQALDAGLAPQVFAATHHGERRYADVLCFADRAP